MMGICPLYCTDYDQYFAMHTLFIFPCCSLLTQGRPLTISPPRWGGGLLSSLALASAPSTSHQLVTVCHKYFNQNTELMQPWTFLAPTGALGVTMSVCPVTRCLEQSIFTHLGQRAGQSTQRAIREQSESNQNITIKIIQSEPLNTASCWY